MNREIFADGSFGRGQVPCSVPTHKSLETDIITLRAENARLREVLGAIVTRMEWHSNAIGWRVKHDLPAGTITQARAVLAEVSK